MGTPPHMGYLYKTLTKKIDKDDHKTIPYSSRSLSSIDQLYSQNKREFFRIASACEHRRIYLLVRVFILYNDHKATLNLLKNPKLKVILQTECMTSHLRRYNFEIR